MLNNLSLKVFGDLSSMQATFGNKTFAAAIQIFSETSLVLFQLTLVAPKTTTSNHKLKHVPLMVIDKMPYFHFQCNFTLFDNVGQGSYHFRCWSEERFPPG